MLDEYQPECPHLDLPEFVLQAVALHRMRAWDYAELRDKAWHLGPRLEEIATTVGPTRQYGQWAVTWWDLDAKVWRYAIWRGPECCLTGVTVADDEIEDVHRNTTFLLANLYK